MKGVQSHLASGRAWLANMFNMWLEGLRYPLPNRLRGWLIPSKPCVLISVYDDVYAIRSPQAVIQEEGKERPLSELGEELQTLRQSSNCQPILVLQSKHLLIKKLTVPRSSPKDLESMIGFELQRLTPFNAKDIYYDYYVSAQSETDDALYLSVCLLPASELQALLANIGEPIAPLVITAETQEGKLLPINLLTRVKWDAKSSNTQFYTLPFRPAYFLLLVFSIITLAQAPLAGYRAFSESLSEEIDTHRAQALQLQSELNLLTTGNNRNAFLLNKQSEYVPPLNILHDLTVALPQDTWIRRLIVSTDTVQLEGDTVSAATTLSLVENIPLLAQAEFSAPVSRAPDGEKEQFQITATSRLHDAR